MSNSQRSGPHYRAETFVYGPPDIDDEDDRSPAEVLEAIESGAAADIFAETPLQTSAGAERFRFSRFNGDYVAFARSGGPKGSIPCVLPLYLNPLQAPFDAPALQ